MRDHKQSEDGVAGDESLPPAAARSRAIATVDSRSSKARHHRDRRRLPIPISGNDGENLDHRGVAALIIDDNHRIQAANRQCAALFAGEKLLGRRCYEVFHHRSAPCRGKTQRCPLRHYRESGQPCRVVHVHQTRHGAEHHEVSIHPADAGLCACLELRPVTVASAAPSSCRLVGRSPAFNRMLELLLRAAMRETPVLLIGEPGTCRETVARRLHQLGGKPDDAFFAVPCAGLGRARLASEPALFLPREPLPRPGTLYLDDVGELGLVEQGELLRRMKSAGRGRWPAAFAGESRRLICAARPDLRARVARGVFLEDLYYRISVFPIPVPPLRERRRDLSLLAACLLRQIGAEPHASLHPETLATLDRYPFPGNLRELRRILEHASLAAGSRQILPEHLPPECRT